MVAASRMETRIPYAVKQIVQHELYYYPNTCQTLEELRRDIAQSGGETIDTDSPPKRHQIAWSDPTHYRGTALATNERVLYLARTVKAIEDTRDALPDDDERPYRQCMELTWWRPLNGHEIESRLGISQATRYRMTGQIIAAVAERMGLL